jgi:hypothetical protein
MNEAKVGRIDRVAVRRWIEEKEELPLDAVMGMFPTMRQSLLAKHDDCALSSFFELRYANGWNTHPQARGTVFHLFAAKFLQELREQKKKTLPVGVAEAILVEACRQREDSQGRPIPPEDIVRVPLRSMPELRGAARKFAKDNEFSYDRIVDIERRLGAELVYPSADGRLVKRWLTGQLDAVLFEKPDGAVVIDWKDTWALPPEPKERDPEDFVGADDELRGISYHGYFQQRFYGWLVMKTYRNVNRVTLREFYARKTKARKATLTRDRLPEVEEELGLLAAAFDEAIMQGPPEWPYIIDEQEAEARGVKPLGRWAPQPGKHCGFCAMSRHCPVEEDARIESAAQTGGAAITSFEQAKRATGELQVVERVRAVLLSALKSYVETSGAPVPVKAGKGRRVLGWYETKRGRRFGLFTPDDSDRGGHADLDRQLEEAMREATARAQEAKPKRRRSGRNRPAGKV